MPADAAPPREVDPRMQRRTHPHLPLRRATPADVPALEALIAASARGLGVGYYRAEQTEALVAHVFGVDTRLIADGTYYVVDDPDGGLAAAGGWSARRTLYGGDHLKAGPDADARLDPATEPARIRAFFVHPGWARRGLARRLYETCAAAARAAGFGTFELMATLPGEPAYRALGFAPAEAASVPIPDGTTVPLVRMVRPIGPAPAGGLPAIS
jgi:GNAT superfamily N-acetyltransferase